MKKLDYKFKALWTICEISIIWDKSSRYNSLINTCYKMIFDFENDFSRFKKDSMLSILNTKKKHKVNGDFLNLIYISKEIYNLTNWYFNPLINLENIWYVNSFSDNKFEIKFVSEDLSFEDIVYYWDVIELKNDMNLDFGSIAKGYLADRVSKYLKNHKIKNFLVNMWWDIYASWVNHNNNKWIVWIPSPFDAKKNILALEISNKSISTSWTYIRNWSIGDKKYTHIKNPNWELKNDLISVSIIDEKWYFTDSIATALIAMWYQKALDFCNKNKINYVFILSNWDIREYLWFYF